MTRYAEQTSVSTERSRAEIEGLLVRYGATHFAYMCGPGKAMIEFLANDRRVRFVLPLPDRGAKEFSERFDGRSKAWRQRSVDDAAKAWEQVCRQRWRALCLAVKAKLETVETGISTFEAEFMAHIVDPATNRTVGEVILPQLAKSYEDVDAPQALMLEYSR